MSVITRATVCAATVVMKRRHLDSDGFSGCVSMTFTGASWDVLKGQDPKLSVRVG